MGFFVVPWSHFRGTIGVTLGVLRTYFDGTLRVVLGLFDGPWGLLLGPPGVTLRVLRGHFEGTLG